jgi:site-specific DNA-methyltransferase (adenine-specific)
MDSRVIQLTPAAHKYGNLNLRACGKDFFPPDVFGAPSKKARLGIPVTLQVDGLPNPIETDIPTDKKTGTPRWIFRERKWVRDFVRLHNLRMEDTVMIRRLDERTYQVSPNNNIHVIEEEPSTKHQQPLSDSHFAGAKLNQKIFFENDRLKIINDNVISTTEIENGSIDLIITSPPYNVDIKYASHDDKVSYEEYLTFSNKWLSRCFDWLKIAGRLCLNIPLDKNKGGQQSVGADLTTVAKKVGFRYHSTIIWNEGNISRRTAWGSWLSPAAPYVIAPVELIVILYKSEWKRTSQGKESDITRKEFMDWTNGLWTFSGESKKKIGHPAPFPLELPKRNIKSLTFLGNMPLSNA